MMKLEFWVDERVNTFRKNGKEHALYCQIGSDSPFCITAYESAPKKEEIARAKEIAHRAMEFYHRSIRWPKFEIDEVN